MLIAAVVGPNALRTADAEAAAGPAVAAPSFLDDFTGPAGSAVDAKTWTQQAGAGWGGGQKQAYTPGTQNAWLTGRGSLMIDARGESYTGWDRKTADYTSARIMSKAAVRYGTVSARIRMTGSKGAWPAFWMNGANYPQVGWPFCGEIDVMEALNDFPNLYGSFHGPYVGQTSRSYAYNAGKMTSPAGGLGTGWHVYSAQWTPTSVTFLLDGVPYVSVQKKDLPANQVWALDNPQNIILNIAVGGMPGDPAPPSQFHASMEVDWVRVDPLVSTGPVAPPASSTPIAATPSPTASPSVSPSATPSVAPSPKAAAVRLVGKRAVHVKGRPGVRVDLTSTARTRVRAVIGSGPGPELFDRRIDSGRRAVSAAVPARYRKAKSVVVTVYRYAGTRAGRVATVRVALR